MQIFSFFSNHNSSCCTSRFPFISHIRKSFFFGIALQNIRKIIYALAAAHLNHRIYTFPSKSPTGHFVWRILHNIHPTFSSESLSHLLLLSFFDSTIAFYKFYPFFLKTVASTLNSNTFHFVRVCVQLLSVVLEICSHRLYILK